jgi:hypothetical protein
VVLVPTCDNGRLRAHHFAHWRLRVCCVRVQLPDNVSSHRELGWCEMHIRRRHVPHHEPHEPG